MLREVKMITNMDYKDVTNVKCIVNILLTLLQIQFEK